MDSVTVPDTGERWLHVRTRDAEPVEGWIEARNLISQGMVERSRQLAREDADTPAQATGQLRASTNIRFSPDRSGNDNILMKLESGAKFDIVGWKRVPRPKSSESTESDDVPKAGAAFDLPIALGVLAASGAIERRHIVDIVILGELSLDGSIHPARGVLPIAAATRVTTRSGLRTSASSA